jgi:hypothetical protein
MARWQKGEGWVERTCHTCGNRFLVKRYALKERPAIYCGTQCCNARFKGMRSCHFATIEDLRRLYVDQELPMQAIAEKYGVTLQAIAYQLQQHGIPRRRNIGANLKNPATRQKAIDNHARGPKNSNFVDIPLNQLKTAYESGQSTLTLAATYNVSATTIGRKLKQAGIQLRQPGFCHWRIAKDGHQVQSTWEMQVDNWLSEHQIPHECQPPLPFETAPKAKSPARADFLAKGWYIEIWGVVHNADYANRRDKKRNEYKRHGLPLIELWPRHIEREGLSPLNVLL